MLDGFYFGMGFMVAFVDVFLIVFLITWFTEVNWHEGDKRCL